MYNSTCRRYKNGFFPQPARGEKREEKGKKKGRKREEKGKKERRKREGTSKKTQPGVVLNFVEGPLHSLQTSIHTLETDVQK